MGGLSRLNKRKALRDALKRPKPLIKPKKEAPMVGVFPVKETTIEDTATVPCSDRIATDAMQMGKFDLSIDSYCANIFCDLRGDPNMYCQLSVLFKSSEEVEKEIRNLKEYEETTAMLHKLGKVLKKLSLAITKGGYA